MATTIHDVRHRSQQLLTSVGEFAQYVAALDDEGYNQLSTTQQTLVDAYRGVRLRMMEEASYGEKRAVTVRTLRHVSQTILLALAAELD